MNAKRLALVGIMSGCAVFLCIFLLQISSGNPFPLQSALIMLPAFAVYGFGYAFSYPLFKNWLAKVAGVSGTLVFWGIISQLVFRRGFFLGFFLASFFLVGFVGLAYLPGIFIGIKRLITERSAA
jgi:hypothetical protein